jgi:hypothetical protein
MIRKLGFLTVFILFASAWCLAMTFQANEKTAATVSLCQIVSQPEKYHDSPMTVRVRVKTYRHGTSISDRTCPKQSIPLIAEESVLNATSVSHFYRFLAERRQSSVPIFATITGRLVKESESDFVVKRKFVFKLEAVSDVSEGDQRKGP